MWGHGLSSRVFCILDPAYGSKEKVLSFASNQKKNKKYIRKGKMREKRKKGVSGRTELLVWCHGLCGVRTDLQLPGTG